MMSSCKHPKLDAFHMYHWGQEDAERGLERDEREPDMTVAERELLWAYYNGWDDWHGGHRG